MPLSLSEAVFFLVQVCVFMRFIPYLDYLVSVPGPKKQGESPENQDSVSLSVIQTSSLIGSTCCLCMVTCLLLWSGLKFVISMTTVNDTVVFN